LTFFTALPAFFRATPADFFAVRFADLVAFLTAFVAVRFADLVAFFAALFTLRVAMLIPE
jgi:hypothetical protein